MEAGEEAVACFPWTGHFVGDAWDAPFGPYDGMICWVELKLDGLAHTVSHQIRFMTQCIASLCLSFSPFVHMNVGECVLHRLAQSESYPVEICDLPVQLERYALPRVEYQKLTKIWEVESSPMSSQAEKKICS